MSDAALPDRPRVLEGAVVVAIAGAVVGGVQAAALLGRVGDARRQVADQAPAAADQVAALLIAVGVAGLLYSAALVALALLLRAGRTRARTVLLVLAPFSLLGVVAPTTPGVAAVILVGLAVYMAYRRDASAWVAEVRGRQRTGRP